MMLILRDDAVIEIFDSPFAPPSWIEAIDIENGEYAFCDDHGQQFVGIIIEPAGLFRHARFELQPHGAADLGNALALIDRARLIEPNDLFPDLASLRQHLSTLSQ